jgi:hypothetical protein
MYAVHAVVDFLLIFLIKNSAGYYFHSNAMPRRIVKYLIEGHPNLSFLAISQGNLTLIRAAGGVYDF